jgi:pentatricopeptide repeat protein
LQSRLESGLESVDVLGSVDLLAGDGDGDEAERTRLAIQTIVRSNKSEQALRALREVATDFGGLRVALDEFVARRSVKGVRGIEQIAQQMGAPDRVHDTNDRHDTNARHEGCGTCAQDDASGWDDPLDSPLQRAMDGTALWFALIAAYGSLNRLKSVSRCFKMARKAGSWRGTDSDVRLTNTFLHALHTDIKAVFVRARQMMDDGTVLDTTSFNVLLKACMKEGDTKRAKMVLAWMQEQRVRPDGISYSTLIKTFSYSNNFDGVLYVYDLMDINGFEMTDDVRGNLLIACGVACQHDTALMIWRDRVKESNGGSGGDRSIKKPIPMSLYESMMISCNQASQGDRSLEVLDEIKERGLVPSVKAYNLALAACRAQPGKRARPLDLINAVNIFSEMKVRGLDVDGYTYGQLFEIAAEASQGPIASWLKSSMETDNVRPNVVINTSLMKALIRSGMVEEAIAIFQKMIFGPSTLKPTGATYRTLAKELREQGFVREALKIYTAMRKANFAPNNIEFQKLISAAAETAFSQKDSLLQAEVADLCRVTSLSILDLHGTSRYEARAAVLCVLGMIASEYRASSRQPSPLTIIVGRGEHSPSEPVLPGVVRKCLDELQVRPIDDERLDGFEELQPLAMSEGRIVISGRTLHNWLGGGAECT